MSLPLAPFLTVWAVLALNIASPGPNVLNTITTAMGSGRAAGLASAAAVAVGVGIWCVGMTFGMAALFLALPSTRAILTLIAICLLLWFATRYLCAAWQGWRGNGKKLAGRSGLSLRASFLRSLSVNALNPKALTTWVLILTLFPVARAGAGDIALLCAGASAIAFAIHAAYAVTFSTAPAARAYLKAAPAINATVGLFFTGFAIKLAVGLLS
ncbi:LysE family transporter [Defluviimonas aestuarii]|uniref:LysE family translocator n=1 Tax=Albidovulum aestuarii TaxID=1130726 RepID=UPI002499C5D0|nr:LysE family transporter [Defluviimonas aestuarii]MDI3338784.1 LysE family transporter [Defluviimonas aestuarii]